MSFTEDVNLPTVLIEGNSSTENDLGSESFNTTYILNGIEPEGVLQFDLTVTDYLGNQSLIILQQMALMFTMIRQNQI